MNTAGIAKKQVMCLLNNHDMLIEVAKSKKIDDITPTLAKMFILIVSRYAKKYNYANYTYNDDMQSYALMMLVKTWRSFNPKKSQNPFAFFTQCVKNSFSQYLNQEKKQRNIRDEMLVDQGLTPSYTYQSEYEDRANASLYDHDVLVVEEVVRDDHDHLDE